MNDRLPVSDPVFKTIGEIADRRGVAAYVIGGFVRDYYLGRPDTDIDIVVVGSGIEVAEELGRELRTKVSVFKNFGTAMLRHRGMDIEFVGARRESYRADSRKPVVEDGTLEDDQNRRDFTINAMAWGLNSGNFGELLDPFNGMDDLRNGLIRTPLDPDITFSDDPLRMIRAIRFAAQLGFTIVPETLEAISRNRERISIVSKERITTEVNKIMLSPKPSVGFLLFDRTGLLEILFPELYRMKDTKAVGTKTHKNIFLHTLQVVDNVSAKSGDLWLRWAALYHDVGKPRTRAFEDKAGWTFHGHDAVGAKMVPHLFRGHKLPMNEKMKFVQKLVGLHLRPIVLAEDIVTDSAVRRLLFDAGDDIDALMTLCEADITSKNDAKVKRYLSNFRLVREKLKEIEEKDRVRNFQPPVSGELIMQTYGISPCRIVGDIKSEIKDAILDGRIRNDFDEAFALMEEIAARHGLCKPE